MYIVHPPHIHSGWLAAPLADPVLLLMNGSVDYVGSEYVHCNATTSAAVDEDCG